jgi:hypothetical protein
MKSQELQTTNLGHLYNEKIARRFIQFINDDFTTKHNKQFRASLEHVPNHAVTNKPCWIIKLETTENDWEYIVERLRPAFLAVRYCTE